MPFRLDRVHFFYYLCGKHKSYTTMKKLLISLLLVVGCQLSFAQTHGTEVIHLWPQGAPTLSGLSGDEVDTQGGGRFITNISEAVMTVYKPNRPNGTCIICCPGGGYMGCAMLHEGSDMAQWLNNLGYTFVVLKYRMPNGHHNIPLEDGERAITLVRQHAAQWGIQPNKVGIMGSSAGGHFAATLSTLYTSAATRPDFSILLYPVISMEKDLTHLGSRESLLGKNPTPELVQRYDLDCQVNAQTPPAFLVLASDDDVVNPFNGINYFQALLQQGVKNCSLHVYPFGGHGFGYDEHILYHREWTAELENWLRITVQE